MYGFMIKYPVKLKVVGNRIYIQSLQEESLNVNRSIEEIMLRLILPHLAVLLSILTE